MQKWSLFLLAVCQTVTQSWQTDTLPGNCTQWPPVCSQRCTSLNNGVRCSCVDGYQLSSDGTRCHASGPAFLVFTQTNAIIKMTLDTAKQSTIYQGNSLISAIALDMVESRVFWYDSDSNMVLSTLINDYQHGVTKVITHGLDHVTSLAYDWSGKNLYIGDIGLRKILACSMKTRECTTVLRNIVPHALSVNSLSKKLVWSECENGHHIKVASLTGLNMKTLVRDKIICANSLFIDYPLDRVYWADPQLHLAESIKLDGTQRQEVSVLSMTYPVDVALFEDEIYYSYLNAEQTTSHIGIINKYPTVTDHPHDLAITDNHILSDILIYHPSLQMPDGQNACHDAPCSDVCLLDEYSTYRCVCPEGKMLDLHMRTCHVSWESPNVLVANGNKLVRITPDRVGAQIYEVLMTRDQYDITALAFHWSLKTAFFAQIPSDWQRSTADLNSPQSSISSFELSDPADVNVLIDDVQYVISLAVDWISHHLYWVDAMRSVVEISNLDGSSRMLLLDKREILTPRSITVDPLNWNLYISDCDGRHPLIISSLDGHETRSIEFDMNHFGFATTCINSMTADVRTQQLFWTDSRHSIVLSADLAGSNVNRIRRSLAPLSITATGNDIYWTDEHSDDIIVHPRINNTHRISIAVDLKPLDAIVAIDDYLQPDGSNGCSKENGQCSHLCLSINALKHYCECPAPMVLGADHRTCVSKQDYVKTPSSFIVRSSLRPVRLRGTSAPTVLFREPDRRCSRDYCSGRGHCLAMDDDIICVCNSGSAGRWCEIIINVTSTAIAVDADHSEAVETRPMSPPMSLPTSLPTSPAYAIVIAVLCSVLLFGIVLSVIYVVQNHRRLRPGQVFSLKSLLRQKLSTDDSEHRKRLVSIGAIDAMHPAENVKQPEVVTSAKR